MPNSSYVIRTAPLKEALAHFVLRVDVVCAMQTIRIAARSETIMKHRIPSEWCGQKSVREIVLLEWPGHEGVQGSVPLKWRRPRGCGEEYANSASPKINMAWPV